MLWLLPTALGFAGLVALSILAIAPELVVGSAIARVGVPKQANL